MYEQCEADPYSYYYDVFFKQFLQTLGQLSAGLLTSTLAIPVYSYYVRRNNVNKNNDSVDEEKKDDQESVKGYEGDSDTETDTELDGEIDD